jgi:hypothetical protein
MLAAMLSAVGGEVSHEFLAKLIDQSISNTNFLFTLMLWLIGAGFVFSAGCYVYTWLATGNLWKKIDLILTNHIQHLKARLDSLEETRQFTRDGENRDGLR